MHRLRRAAFPLALLAAVAAVIGVVVDDSAADLENLVFTSRSDHVRVIVPRGWRASEQPSYPNGANKTTVLNGVLLWMAHSQPQGQIVLTGEEFTHKMYCAWPVACRTSNENLAWKYACALRDKLSKLKLKVDEVQAGPKDNEAAGLPSVWFEYQDGKHFLRQAIAFSADRAFSLVLSAPNPEARATHTRAFEQALRTMQLVDIDDARPASTALATTAGSGSASSPTPDVDAITGSVARGANLDAGVADAGPVDAGVAFESPPPPKPSPVGPCK